MIISNNKKTINVSILLKSGFWYTVSNFFTRALVFITIPLFTRLMTKAEFGDFSIYAMWQYIFLVICGLESYATLNRARFDYTDERELNSYITSCLLLNSSLTAILILAYNLFPIFFARLLILNRKNLIVMFAYLLVFPAFQMFQAKQRIEYRYKLSATISFICVISATIASLLMVIWCKEDRLYGRIVGHYVPSIAISILMYIYFLRNSLSIDWQKCKYAISMGAPLVFSTLGGYLLISSTRVVVQHICSTNEVALIALTGTCANIMQIFSRCLDTAWAPWLFDKLKRNELITLKKVFRFYVWFLIFCTVCVLLIGPEIIKVLGGQKYFDAIQILAPNMLTGIFTVLTSNYVNLEIYYKKTYLAGVLTATVTLFNIIASAFCTRMYGYRGACYVAVFSQILLIALHAIATSELNTDNVLPKKELLLEIIISVCLMPCSLFIYKYPYIRLAIIVFLIFTCIILFIIKRKLILSFVHQRLLCR